MNFMNDIPPDGTPYEALHFSKGGVIVISQRNTDAFASLALPIRKYFQSRLHREPDPRRSEIQHFTGEKHPWNEETNTIKAYSQILNEERDPGLVSKIKTTNETVSLNSHSGLQR